MVINFEKIIKMDAQYLASTKLDNLKNILCNQYCISDRPYHFSHVKAVVTKLMRQQKPLSFKDKIGILA